jgi:hypothetical protein
MLWILLIVFLAGSALGAFAVLLLGIRTEERHMTLSGQPHTLASASTRRLLSPYGRRPDDDTTEPHSGVRR